MTATITSKGQITIPARLRERLRLKTGQTIEFDESAPFLKGVPVFDADEMRSVLGCAKGSLGMSAMKWLEKTRGSVALPRKRR